MTKGCIMPKIVDITGQRFGKLTALKKVAVKSGNSVWLCSCECGGEKQTILSNLKNGNTKSCGCLIGEAARKRPPTKHGYGRRGKSPATYVTWEAMRARCNNPNSDWYHRYGGRGIKICERWNDFALFLRDMGERPNGMTLDRINPDGDYEPNNCRWATPAIQSANKAKK